MESVEVSKLRENIVLYSYHYLRYTPVKFASKFCKSWLFLAYKNFQKVINPHFTFFLTFLYSSQSKVFKKRIASLTPRAKRSTLSLSLMKKLSQSCLPVLI